MADQQGASRRRKQARKQPRESHQEKMDKLAGIVRDAKTGIVLARTTRHPLADLLMSAPMGPGLPPLNLHPFDEISQILAIHLWDNLDCSPPRNPLYKYRPNREQLQNTGIPGALWVPIGSPDVESSAVVADEVIEVADITDYSPLQIEAMKRQIRDLEIRDKLAANLDAQVQQDG